MSSGVPGIAAAEADAVNAALHEPVVAAAHFLGGGAHRELAVELVPHVRELAVGEPGRDAALLAPTPMNLGGTFSTTHSPEKFRTRMDLKAGIGAARGDVRQPRGTGTLLAYPPVLSTPFPRGRSLSSARVVLPT